MRSRMEQAVWRALVVVTGAVAVAAAAAPAEAQRRTPRAGVAVDPPPRVPTSPYPGANVAFDPRWYGMPPGRHHPRDVGGVVGGVPGVVYVVPVPVGAGYDGYGSPAPRGGGVYDTNGRPLSIGFDAGPSANAVPSYTPDFSGSPYVVIEGGAMLVDLPSGERRSVTSCAVQDPDGRPRTVFYQGGPAGVVLRSGQRGRVQGTPSSGARTCYAADAWGRMVLSY